MNKKIIFPIVAIAVLGAGVFSATSASANGFSGSSDLVQKISKKFNLKKADVQAIFDELKKEHQAKLEIKLRDKLSAAVNAGKITQIQKELILQKNKELQTQRQSSLDLWKNLTPEERKAKMQDQRSDLETWANENGIDAKYVLGFDKPRGRFER